MKDEHITEAALVDALRDLDKDYTPSPGFHSTLMARIRLEEQTERESVIYMTNEMQAQTANEHAKNSISERAAKAPLKERLIALWKTRPAIMAAACCCLLLVVVAGGNQLMRGYGAPSYNNTASMSRPMSGGGGYAADSNVWAGGTADSVYPASAPEMPMMDMEMHMDMAEDYDAYDYEKAEALMTEVMAKDEAYFGSSLTASVAEDGGRAPTVNSVAPPQTEANRAPSYDSRPSGESAGGANGAQASGAQAAAAQKIIRNGNIRLEVDRYDEAYGEIKAAAAALGGYVTQENTYIASIINGHEQKAGYMQIKVPYALFDELIVQTEALGKVLDSGVNAEDVTARYIDLQARIGVYETKYQRLLALLEQSGELQTILAVENELAMTNAELESLKGQMRYLLDRTDYSTLSVNLSEKMAEATEVRLTGFAGFTQRVRESFNMGTNSLIRSIGNIVLWLAWNIVGITLTAILFVVVWVIWLRKWLARRRSRRSIDAEVSRESVAE